MRAVLGYGPDFASSVSLRADKARGNCENAVGPQVHGRRQRIRLPQAPIPEVLSLDTPGGEEQGNGRRSEDVVDSDAIGPRAATKSVPHFGVRRALDEGDAIARPVRGGRHGQGLQPSVPQVRLDVLGLDQRLEKPPQRLRIHEASRRRSDASAAGGHGPGNPQRVAQQRDHVRAHHRGRGKSGPPLRELFRRCSQVTPLARDEGSVDRARRNPGDDGKAELRVLPSDLAEHTHLIGAARATAGQHEGGDARAFGHGEVRRSRCQAEFAAVARRPARRSPTRVSVRSNTRVLPRTSPFEARSAKSDRETDRTWPDESRNHTGIESSRSSSSSAPRRLRCAGQERRSNIQRRQRVTHRRRSGGIGHATSRTRPEDRDDAPSNPR